MNQATRTHLFASAVAGDPTMALVFIERNLWVQFVSMTGQTVQITNLNKGQCEEVVSLLLEWSKPGWYARAEKWENTARQATARVRELEAQVHGLNLQIDIAVDECGKADLQIKDLQAKLAQALDRSAIIANDYIQLRKVAEHNEKVMDQAIGELKRMAKEAGIELPTPAGQLAACEVSPPAKPLAYIMPPSKENGNANFMLFTYPDGKLVFDDANQGVVVAEVHKRGYDLLAPWDSRHPYKREPAPVPAYPAPEQGSSETAPARPFVCPRRHSAQQRPGNVLQIKETGKWGRYSWGLFREDGTPYKPQQCDGKFPSIEQAIQWCKRHDFDYCY